MRPVRELNEEYIPVRDVFLDILKIRQDAGKNTTFKQNQDFLSVSFFDSEDNNKSFWVTLGKKRNKLEFKYFYYLTVDCLIDSVDKPTPSKNRRVAEYFSMSEDIYRFERIILAVYDYRDMESNGKLFDCCQNYMECSDARACIHPDEEFRKRCTYRQKLKRGIIFFGQNRNID
ncbi:hypothetical protein SDC9_54247 [bioreactor metagenome]|uniref:Uncharacterized protein n=1 Tax=bioreactor metagenome TaxID=1076179 RepID=A0A644WVI2_9ZZZZ